MEGKGEKMNKDVQAVSIEQVERSEVSEIPKKSKILHDFAGEPRKRLESVKKLIIVAVIVGLGTATGYFLSNIKDGKTLISEEGLHKVVKTEKTVGSTDTKTFRDKAEGILQKGGIDGEGTHKLIRPGGESQNVYLTSSVINLDDYVGKKVRVWGETFTAQKAGWLMDVGKIEFL